MVDTESTANKSTLNTIVTVTTLIIPLLYLIGFFYDLGYLEPFGLNNQYFPRDTQYYLVQSYIAISFLLTIVLKPLLIIISILFSLPVIYFLLLTIKIDLLSYIKATPKKSITNEKQYTLLNIYLKKLIVLIYIIGAAIYLVLIPYFAYSKGLNIANNAMSTFETCQSKTLKDCVFLYQDNQLIGEGYLITKSSTHIAIWNDGKTRVYPLKEEMIEIRQDKNSTEKEKTNE